MAKRHIKWSTLGVVVMLFVLFAILGAAGWFASRAWTEVSGPPMPATGYAAMILGTVFSLVVGCGLMALLFYSSRHGYDDQFKPKDEP
jgi:cation transporter-like permease